MLEFNINDRLVNLEQGKQQTKEQVEMLPKINTLITLVLRHHMGWGVQCKLVDALMEYGCNRSVPSILEEYQEHMTLCDFKILDGKKVKALPSDSFYCNGCGEYHSTKHTNKVVLSDGNIVCDRALKEQATTCRSCGKTFLSIFNDFNGLCRQCFEENQKYNIKRYHDTPPLKFYDEDGQTHNTSGEFYGLELEVDRGGERNDMSKDVIKLLHERVYTMHDGSLNNGFEIITHPHTEQALMDLNWRETFKWLIHKGYRSHDISTCGLHLHINRSVFKNSDALAKMIYFYENNFNEVIKVSRRDRDRANRWAGRYYSSDIDMVGAYDILDRYDQQGSHDMRYKCVNLQKRNTVEIRIMRGTLNYNSFMACLDFMITVAKNSNKVTDVNSWEQWLDGISDNTKEYLSARQAFGYPPEEQVIEDDCYNMTNEEIRNMEEIVCAL